MMEHKPVTLQQQQRRRRWRFPAVSSFLPLSTSSASFSLLSQVVGGKRHNRSMRGEVSEKPHRQMRRKSSPCASLHLLFLEYKKFFFPGSQTVMVMVMVMVLLQEQERGGIPPPPPGDVMWCLLS